MPKSKFFTGCVMLLVMLVAVNVVSAKPVIWSGDETVIQRSHPNLNASATPRRDTDDFMTFRWLYSSDGGAHWSGIMGAGMTGMFEVNNAGDTVEAWGDPSYAFGTVVDGSNNIHFIAPLTSFGEGALNPTGRQNGVYDVKSDATGEAVSYNLIAAQAADHKIIWADGGMNAAGVIYAIWVDIANDLADIVASKSTDGGSSWSAAFVIKSGLDVAGGQASIFPYAHITPHIGADFFYVIYQTPTEATWTHHILKVPAALAGNVTTTDPGAQSAAYVSYYIGSSNPIDMDPANDAVYFGVRDTGSAKTTIGNLAAGNWSMTRLAGAQRYPSVGLDVANATPYVFSNFGLPAGGSYHKNWLAMDNLGYNGGDWSSQIIIDSVEYNGTRDLLYCNQGVWTSEGNLVVGENVWGSFTPEGFQVKVKDGEGWAASQRIWSIFDEGETMVGGYIAQNSIVAGADNYVFVSLCGQFGATDFDGPMIGEPTLSSYMLEQPWNLTCELSDINGITGTTINWKLTSAAEWDYADADSGGNPDDQGNGMYYYHMRNDTLNGEAVTAGDSIWFYIDAIDNAGSGNYAAGWENLLVVNYGWAGVWEPVVLPTKPELGQNYPNPFNNTTSIPFALERTQRIKLQVWDVNGRLVSTLVDGRATAGHHTVSWNPTNATSGVYIYTLDTANERFIGKMTLLH